LTRKDGHLLTQEAAPRPASCLFFRWAEDTDL
jgi:hypothetical protein